MKFRSAGLATLVVGLVVGAGLGVAGERLRRARADEPVATAAMFEHVLSAIRENFVDSLSDADLYAKAAKGVVTTLGDPYSTLLTHDEYRRYREALNGNGLILGLSLTGGLTGARVGTIIPGSPADRVGINQGDFVVSIDGQPTERLSGGRLGGVLRSETGQPVTITVRTPGDSVPVALTVAPAETDIPAVHSLVRVTDSIGYLALRTISTHADRALERALDSLEAEDLSGVVLDLRDNPGGRLDEGLAIADLFLQPGQRIGAMSKRGIWARTYEASQRQRFPRLKLVLLVNNGTASSAEIIASALRDHHRAVLIGERTRGKGLVQTTIPLGDSLAVRLSTGRWEGPGGTALTGGLVPDILIRDRPAADHPRLGPLDSDGIARILEQMARELRPPQGGELAAFGDAEVERFRLIARERGVKLTRAQVDEMRGPLELELQRIRAVERGDRAAAARWTLRADPVASAGLDWLSARIFPPVAGVIHHP